MLPERLPATSLVFSPDHPVAPVHNVWLGWQVRIFTGIMGPRMSYDSSEPGSVSAIGSRRNLMAWSLFAGLILFAVLAVPFFAGRIYTADDLGAFHFPTRYFYSQQLARGESYDWMPSLFSGFYLTGEGQAGVYHPLHQLLYRLLPLRAALGWEYLISYPLMMAGCWLFLRQCVGRAEAALFGALLFTFCSFNLLHFIHPNAIAIIAHLPWLLWAIGIVLTDARTHNVAWASALIALLTGSQILLGYPQYVWFSLIAEAAYAVYLLQARRYSARSGCSLCVNCDECVGCTTQPWPRLVIAKAIGLLLGGVQLLPSLDAWLHSGRAAADSNYSAWGSLHPLNLLQLLAPYLFRERTFGDNPNEFGLYAGAVPLVLAAWLIARRRDLGQFRSLTWATFGFAGACLMLSLGEYGLLYPIASSVPVLRSLRFPCRYLVLFQLAMAVLSAVGFYLLIRKSRQARTGHYHERKPWVALWRDFEPLWCVVILSAIVAAIGIAFCHEPQFSAVPAILAGPALIALAATLLVLAARGRPWAFVALIVLAAADLGWYGLGDAVYPSSNYLESFAQSAQVPPGKPDGRVLANLLRFNQPGLRTGDLMTVAGWNRADGYAALEPRRTLDYGLLPALRVAGVRWVRRHATTENIAGLSDIDNDWRQVPNPLPRARMVSQTRLGSDPAGDLARISPDTTVITEVPLGLPPSKPGTATIRSETPGRFEIDVNCPAPQLLVLSESYHHGWRASVDGGPANVYRVNGDFMGCLVAAGEHRVVVQFAPDSLRHGWLLSCLGLGMVSVCFFGLTSESWYRDFRR